MAPVLTYSEITCHFASILQLNNIVLLDILQGIAGAELKVIK